MHYESPTYDNLGARPRVSDKGDGNPWEEYRKKMDTEMFKKHEELEYREPAESDTKQHNFPEDNQGQFEDYEPEESTPNKPNYPSMESFYNKESMKLDQNFTSIKKTRNQENLHHQWGDIDNYQETEVENTTPIRNRVVFNTKFHKNFPTQRQDQPNRSFQSENQDHQRFQRPPPNMEKDKIIKEINKMGINQRSNTQQDLHEQETNRKAIEGIRESFMEKEQTKHNEKN